MTREEIIKLANEAELCQTIWIEEDCIEIESVIQFAKLVAEREREACAKVADQISNKYGWGYYGNEVDTADEIAAAIRARGQA